MSTGLIALIMVIAVIILAVITKRCTECLLLGSLIGCIFVSGKNFLGDWVQILQDVVADNAWLWLVCGLFGCLIALLKASNAWFLQSVA